MPAAATSSRQHLAQRTARAIAYLAAYVAFDWASYISPVAGLNITPWNPQQALAVALLVRRPRAFGLIFLGLLLAEVVVRGATADPGSALAASLLLTASFAAIATAVRRAVDLQSPLGSHRELLRFAAIVTLGSLASAVLYVAVHSARWPGGTGPLVLVLRYWVGDAVALLVTLPLLLLLAPPARRSEAVGVLRTRVWWTCTVLTGGALALVFGRGQQDYFKYFYLLLPPVVWAAVRFGVSGAVLSSFTTQVGLLAVAHAMLRQDPAVFELQALMAATAVTALLLGVAVDERARAEAEVRASMRLSAAGQMAAALAHELSQPITALNNYAEACQELAQAEGPPDPARRDRLLDALRRLVEQARLTGTITRRMRDFFRSGATSLQPTSVGALVQQTVEAHRELADRLAVGLSAEVEPGLPGVRLDPIQFSIVLRNLVANAIESAAGHARPEVRVRAKGVAAGVRIDVVDSGPGIADDRVPTLFEPGPSGKPQGMGVGLSICRSIVEAHGGTLWAEPGRHGRLSILIPLDTPDAGHA